MGGSRSMILKNTHASLSADEYLDIVIGSSQLEYEKVCLIFKDLHALRAEKRSAYSALIDTTVVYQLKTMDLSALFFKLVRFQLYKSKEILKEVGKDEFIEILQNAKKLMAAKFGSDHC
jgi:hypothetical protein